MEGEELGEQKKAEEGGLAAGETRHGTMGKINR